MSKISYQKIATDGLWSNNPGLVQLLGLCPLLAVSTTTVNGLGLGLATVFVLTATNTVISMIRNVVRPELRLPVFVLLIASIVTAVQLAISAYTPELYKVLGIFIPLIVTNCIVIGRAEAFASRQSPPRAFWDGLTMGLGFAAVLLALGAFRLGCDGEVALAVILAQSHLADLPGHDVSARLPPARPAEAHPLTAGARTPYAARFLQEATCSTGSGEEPASPISSSARSTTRPSGCSARSSRPAGGTPSCACSSRT